MFPVVPSTKMTFFFGAVLCPDAPDGSATMMSTPSTTIPAPNRIGFFLSIPRLLPGQNFVLLGLRTFSHSGFFDRQPALVRIEGRKDPQRHREQVLAVPQRKLV